MEVFLERKECLSQAEIVGYLKEELEESKLHEIEMHLIECDLCSTAVETYKARFNTEIPEMEDWSSFKTKLKPAETATATPVLSSKKLSFNRVAAVAVVFLIAVSGILYWNHSKDERRFHEYERAFDFTQDGFSFRGIDEEKMGSSGLVSAIELFNEKAYAESLRELELLLERKPENVVATFYAGMNALKLNKTEEAIHYLSVSRINGDLHYEDASWYLALAHLQKGDTQEALLILKELEKVGDSFYQKELKRLIKDLEKS